MGQVFSNVKNKMFPKKEFRTLMVGFDGSGKTTILYKIKMGQILSTVPTIGFNVETVEFGNMKFTVWDIGGQDKMRCLWRHYYQNTHGIIFVIDSSDVTRVEQAGRELKLMLEEHDLRKALVLVLANKQDLPDAMSPEDMTSKLKLTEIKNRQWYVQGTCALQSEGLTEGFNWLCKEISKQEQT